MKKSLWGEWIPCCFCSSPTHRHHSGGLPPSFQHHLALDTHYSLLNTHLYSRGASQVVLVVKNPPANAGDLREPGSGRPPGGGPGNPLQYPFLENPMDRGTWRATVHGIAKSWTRLKRLSTHLCNVLGGERAGREQ